MIDQAPVQIAPAKSTHGNLTVDLRRVGRHDLALAGGKGANLGELIRAGFPVPEGFVVTTAAYDVFVKEGGLNEPIARATGDEQQHAALRAAFTQAAIPPAVELAILTAYQRLGRGPVAVRSSATAEDLPNAAFAGQQESYLNIEGEAALLDAVRRCWTSLWGDRAIAYRARLGLDQAPVKLAVVVQRLAPAVAAGVMFTANPVTGARDEIVVDASPGLGDAVVSGRVTPDHYVLHRHRLPWRGWTIGERRAGRREVVVRPLPGGGTEQITPEDAAGAGPVLPDRVVHRLASLGEAIQRHFDAPQDIEWAWTGSRIFIVQSRPITALPAAMPPPNRILQRIAGLVGELMPARPYPLEVTTWSIDLMESAFLAPLFGLLGLAFHFDQIFVEEDGVVVRLEARNPVRPTPAILLAPFRLLRQARRYDPADWRVDPLLAEALARTRFLEGQDLTALAWPELLDTVRQALAIPALVGEVRIRYLPRTMLAAGGLLLVLRLLGRLDLFATLLTTGVETRTLAANRALEALAARIRTEPVLAATFAADEPGTLPATLAALPAGQALLAELRGFLDQYGHREVGGLLLPSRPTWKDAPELVLGMLKGMALAEVTPPAGRASWEAARDEVLAHPLFELAPARAAFLDLLAAARRFPSLREDTHFDFTLPLPILRRSVLEIGRRLVAAGVLDRREDVFHLKWGEIETIFAWPPAPDQAADLRALVARRQAKRAALAGTPLVDPRYLAGETGSNGDALARGTPGSPGVATGPVRVVHDGAEFGRLQPGDVLVAPYTNPAWTPLFQRVAAVVVDSGGAASHAAIVAREYGVPAVMGAVDATRRLTDGQRVRVDGSAGLVFAAGQDNDGSEGVASGGLPEAAQVVDALLE